MQTDNRLLDDLARVATSALGTLQGAKSEVAARLRDQFERVLGDLDMVNREEFDVVKAMAAAARTENEALAARIDSLEALIGGSKPKKKAARGTAKPKPKAAAKASSKGARAGAGSVKKAASKAKTKPRPKAVSGGTAKSARAAGAKARSTSKAAPKAAPKRASTKPSRRTGAKPGGARARAKKS